ncbi:hypothetical protein A7X67_11790 [Clostridium sp. W14A]|nr:hypothetical protein A7X67_11790 [Clostridium sp. W14A]
MFRLKGAAWAHFSAFSCACAMLWQRQAAPWIEKKWYGIYEDTDKTVRFCWISRLVENRTGFFNRNLNSEE